MDEQGMATEQNEDQAYQQILQLCQSGDPAALGQIAQIVQKLIQDNQAEEGQEGAEGNDMAGKVMERIKANRAQSATPQE